MPTFRAEYKIQNSGRLFRTSPMKSLAFIHMGSYVAGLLPASLQAPGCMIASTSSSRVLIPSCMTNQWNGIVLPMGAQHSFHTAEPRGAKSILAFRMLVAISVFSSCLRETDSFPPSMRDIMINSFGQRIRTWRLTVSVSPTKSDIIC